MLYKFTHNGTKEEIDKFIKEFDILCSLGAIINLEIKGVIRDKITLWVKGGGYISVCNELIIYEDYTLIDNEKFNIKCV